MRSRRRIRRALAVLFVLSFASPGLAQEPKEIRITADEFSYSPAEIQVSVGEVRFIVTNRGEFPHSLAIVGREEKIGYIESGETKRLVVKFDKAGEVVFYCSQPGHRGRGMEGTLKVGKK